MEDPEEVLAIEFEDAFLLEFARRASPRSTTSCDRREFLILKEASSCNALEKSKDIVLPFTLTDKSEKRRVL